MRDIAFSVSILVNLVMILLLLFGSINLLIFKKKLHQVINKIQNENFEEIDFKTIKNRLFKTVIDSIEKLNSLLMKNSKTIKQIVDNNKDILDQVKTDDSILNIMKSIHENLQKNNADNKLRYLEEEKHNWTIKGEAMFGELMHSSEDNLESLSFQIIKTLVDYLNANQGALFVQKVSDETKVLYELKGAVAYDRKKLLKKEFEIGEGLIGRCAFEKLSIYIEDVPDDYINITSGLGNANPNAILLVPAKVDNEVYAVIELASFNKFEPYQIEFIEKIGKNIASIIANIRSTENIKKLLNQSKTQSEELASQEEELRQNLEELQATQDEVNRLREEDKRNQEKMLKEIELHQKTLTKILNQIPGKIFLKDDQCRMLIVNQAVLDAHKVSMDDLLGKNDFDFIENKSEAQKYYDAEQEIIRTGKTVRELQKEVINNTGVYLDSIKMPFYIDYLGVTGILGIQNDITKTVKLENEVEKLKAVKN